MEKERQAHDLKRARELEAQRYSIALKGLDSQERARIERVNAEMASRGLQNSDVRLQVLFEVRLEKLNKAIESRIEIRKGLLRGFPDLGSPLELKRLMEPIEEEISQLRRDSQKRGLIIPPEVFSRIQEHAQTQVDSLKKEISVVLPAKSKTIPPTNRSVPAVSLGRNAATVATRTAPPAPAGVRTTMPIATNMRSTPVSGSVVAGIRGTPVSMGPPATNGAALSPEAVYSKIQEVIRDVDGRDGKLAEALSQLATAIHSAPKLGDQRTEYLEQVQFIGEQALRPKVIRRLGVVRGLLVALQSGLGGVASVAPTLKATGPMLASYFGVSWPSA